MKRVIVVSLLAVSVSACAAIRADREFNDVVGKAENEIKLAQQSGYLWTNTEKFLADAKEAKQAGDTDKALKLAKKALEEATMAQDQAKMNANPKANFAYRE